MEMGLEEIRRLKASAGIQKPKKNYVIPKKSAKKIKQDILAKGDDEALDLWFEDRRKDMKGVCSHCGKKSCKDDDKYFKFSIAHILPKSIFKSVSTHRENFIELCFWGGNCHGNFDNGIIDMIDLHCFDEVIQKFVAIYPSIAKEERRKIPSILLDYIETDL